MVDVSPVRTRRSRTRRKRSSRGASAVEFALISVILFPMLLGVIDYGMWFNDSLNTRQGVRETVRQGVVGRFTSCGSASTDLARLRCVTKQQISSVAGTSYAKVKVPEGWVKGRPLVVCGMVKVTGVTGITPLPSDSVIRSKTQMSIEMATPVPSGASATGASASEDTSLPSGMSWGWC